MKELSLPGATHPAAAGHSAPAPRLLPSQADRPEQPAGKADQVLDLGASETAAMPTRARLQQDWPAYGSATETWARLLTKPEGPAYGALVAVRRGAGLAWAPHRFLDEKSLMRAEAVWPLRATSAAAEGGGQRAVAAGRW